MKKKLGVLVLTLSALATACASSGPSSQPTPPQTDPGEGMVQARPSELPSRPANATAAQTARLASR
jgi:hypothetical protein